MDGRRRPNVGALVPGPVDAITMGKRDEGQRRVRAEVTGKVTAIIGRFKDEGVTRVEELEVCLGEQGKWQRIVSVDERGQLETAEPLVEDPFAGLRVKGRRPATSSKISITSPLLKFRVPSKKSK